MGEESYQESFSTIKERMLKTNEIIMMVKNTCSKYQKVLDTCKKMKQELSENGLKMHELTLDNDRLSVLLQKAKLLNEKLETENKSLSADKSALGEGYNKYMVQSQIAIRDLENKLQTSATVPVLKPVQKKVFKTKADSEKTIRTLERQIRSLNTLLRRETEKTKSFAHRYELLTARLKIDAEISKTENVSGPSVNNIGVQTENGKENVKSPNVIEIGVQTENSENCDNCSVNNILEEFKSYPSLLSPMSDDNSIVDLNVVAPDNTEHNYADTSNFCPDNLPSPSRNQDLEEVVIVPKRSKTRSVSSRRNGLFEMKYMHLKNRLKMFTKNLHLRYQRNLLEGLRGLQKHRINYSKNTKRRKRLPESISRTQNMNATTSKFERPQNVILGSSSQNHYEFDNPLYGSSNYHPTTKSEYKIPGETDADILKQHKSFETALNFSRLDRFTSNLNMPDSAVAASNTLNNYEEEAFLNRLVDLVSQRLQKEGFQKKDPGNKTVDISEPAFRSNEGSQKDPTLQSATVEVATDTHMDPCTSSQNTTCESSTDITESADHQEKTELDVILKETEKIKEYQPLVIVPLSDTHNKMSIIMNGEDVHLKSLDEFDNTNKPSRKFSYSGNSQEGNTLSERIKKSQETLPQHRPSLSIIWIPDPDLGFISALNLVENSKLEFPKSEADIQVVQTKDYFNAIHKPRIKILDITVVIPFNSTINKPDVQLCNNSQKNYNITNNPDKFIKAVLQHRCFFSILQVLHFHLRSVEFELFIKFNQVKSTPKLKGKFQSAVQKQISAYKYYKKSETMTVENTYLKMILDYFGIYVEGCLTFEAPLTENNLYDNTKTLPKRALKRRCSSPVSEAPVCDSIFMSCINLSKRVKLYFGDSKTPIHTSVPADKESNYKQDYNPESKILLDNVKPLSLTENSENLLENDYKSQPSVLIIDTMDSQSEVNIQANVRTQVASSDKHDSENIITTVEGADLELTKKLDNTDDLTEGTKEMRDEVSRCHCSLPTTKTVECNSEFTSIPNFNKKSDLKFSKSNAYLQLPVQTKDYSNDKDDNNGVKTVTDVLEPRKDLNDGYRINGNLLALAKFLNDNLSTNTRKLPQMVSQYQCPLPISRSKPELKSYELKTNFQSDVQTQDNYKFYEESVIITAENTDLKPMKGLSNDYKHFGKLSDFKHSMRENELPNITEKLPEKTLKRQYSSLVSEACPEFVSCRNLTKKLKLELPESKTTIQTNILTEKESNYEHDEKLDNKILEDVKLFNFTNSEPDGQPSAFNTSRKDNKLLKNDLSYSSNEVKLDTSDLVEFGIPDEEYIIPYLEIDLPLLSPMSPQRDEDDVENCSEASDKIIPNKNKETIDIDESTSPPKRKSSSKPIKPKKPPKTHLQRNLRQIVEFKKRMLFPLSQNLCGKSKNSQNTNKIHPGKRQVIKTSTQVTNSTFISNLHIQRNEEKNVIDQQCAAPTNSQAISEKHIQNTNLPSTCLNVCNRIKKRKKVTKKVASIANSEMKTSEKNPELILLNNSEGGSENLDILSQIMSEMDRDKPKLLKPTRENRLYMCVDDSTYKRHMLDLMAILREKAEITEDLHPNWYEDRVKPGKKWFVNQLSPHMKELLIRLMKAETSSIQDDIVVEFGHLAVGDVVEMMLQRLLTNHNYQLAATSKSQVLTPVQDRFLNLMVQLEKKFRSNIGQAFLEKVETEMWNGGCRLKSVVSITRLYTTVCRLRGEVARIRNYFCTSFLKTSILCIPLMYTVLTTWPDVFPKEPESENFSPSKVIVYTVHQQKVEACIKVSLQGLKSLLSTYYQYNNVDTWDGERMCEDLFRDYYNQPTLSKEYALQVFFKNQPAKFLSCKLEQIFKPLVYRISNPEHLSKIILLMGRLCKISKNRLTCRQNSELCLWLLKYVTDTTPPIVKMSIQLCVEVLMRCKSKK